MIDASLTLGEMRALRDILQIVGDGRFQFAELKSKLSEMGHSLKGGSLSKWFARIEEAIGGTEAVGKLLVERHHTGSSLTPEGKEVCAALRECLSDLDERIAPLCKNVRQRIRIGLTNSLTSNLLPRVLTEDQQFRKYLSENSRIDVKVVEGEPDELERHVETGWVDFAIAPKAASGDAQRIPFHELKRVLIFNPNGPGMGKLIRFATGNNLNSDEIRQLKKCLAEVTVLIPPRRVMPKLQEKFLPRPTDGRQIKLPQASLRRAWAKLGLGAAITHEELFSHESTDELISIDLSDQKEIGTTKLWFYFKDDVQSLCKPARMLVEAIQRVFPRPSPIADDNESS